MAGSNRHGGSRLSRRLKVLFNGHAGRHNVFRNYFGVKKSIVEAAATGGGAAAASSAPASSPSHK